MKRLTALILCLSMILSVAPVYARENESTDYQSEIIVLKKLGILPEKFYADEAVTKGEASKYIVKAVAPYFENSDLGLTGKIFNDVGEDNEYYNYIGYLKQITAINGDELNNFNPDKEISLEECITIIINALGYRQYAEAKGGYPTGYLFVAKSEGIIKGIKKASNISLTCSELAKIIYNALLADLVVIKSISNGEVETERDSSSNALYEKHNVYKYDAQIVDNGIFSLLGESVGEEDRIVFKNLKDGTLVSAYDTDTGIASYIGSRVDVYIKNDKVNARNTIIAYNLSSRSTQTEIFGKNIISATSSYIEYEENEDDINSSKIKLSSDLAVVYNGKHLTSYTPEDLSVKNGILRVIDTDNDGYYDFLDILNFGYYDDTNKNGTPRNIVVDTVGDSLNCKFNPKMSINLDKDVASCKIVRNNEIKSLEDISSDMVVSVAKCPDLVDGKIFYILVVNDKSVTGKVSEIVTSENKVGIDGNLYKVSKSITDVKSKFYDIISVGSEATVYFDSMGEIAYFEEDKVSTDYAYLIKATFEKKGADAVKMKIFVPEKGVGTYEFAGTVTIDGKIYKNEEDKYKALIKRDSRMVQIAGGPTESEYTGRPIIVKFNDKNQVIFVDTDNPNYETTDINQVKKTKNVLNLYASMNPIGYSDDEIADSKALKAGLRDAMTSTYSTKTNSIKGKFYVTGKTLIISVPDIDTFGIKVMGGYSSAYASEFDYNLIKQYERPITEDAYKTVSTGVFSSDGRYDIQAYDIDEDTGVANLVVLRGRTDVLIRSKWDSSVPMCEFLRIAESYDKDSESFGYRIYYTKDGEEELSASVNFDDLPFYYRYLVFGCEKGDTPYNVKINPLRKGDIIRVVAASGKITHIERVANYDDINSLENMSWYPYGPNENYTTRKGKSQSDFPFYISHYKAEIDGTYVVGVAVPKSKAGNSIVSYTAATKINAIDPFDPSTYSEEFINIGSVQITVITIGKNGDVKIKKGSIDDIKTVAETGSIDKASKLIYFYQSTYNQFVCINKE